MGGALIHNTAILHMGIHEVLQNLHLGQLRGRSAGDLVDPELGELCLELLQLLGQIILALPPQLVRLQLHLHGENAPSL